jgi:hypothetical protein
MRLPSVLDPGPRLRIFAAITITATAVISFDSIRHLAEYAHFGKLAWIFPLTLDAVAAFGMDLWVTRSPAWKQARALALAAIIGSLIGNVVDHWISSKDLLPAVLGAVPPGMLAALLAVLHRHASGTASVRSGPDTAVRDAVWRSLPQADRYRFGGPSEPVRSTVPGRVDLGPVPSVVPVPVHTEVRTAPVRSQKVRADRELVRRSGGPADDVIIKAIRDQAAGTGRLPSKREVMAEHGVGSGRALRLLALAKETTTTTEATTDE